MSDLTQKRCVPCEGGVPSLGKSEVEKYLSQLKGWLLNGKWITKEFDFTDSSRR
jgi:4a-hydroxytetrahydrobiopterin dehydratase